MAEKHTGPHKASAIKAQPPFVRAPALINFPKVLLLKSTLSGLGLNIYHAVPPFLPTLEGHSTSKEKEKL